MYMSSNLTWPTFRGGPHNVGVSATTVRTPTALPPDGEMVQYVHIGGIVWGTPVTDAADNVYVGGTNRRFCRVRFPTSTSEDATTKKNVEIDWQYHVDAVADSLIDSAACVIDDQQLVVVPGGDGKLHALDSRTGERRWVFTADHATHAQHTSGVIVNSFEGNIQTDGLSRIFAGCDNSQIYCIDVATGRRIWNHTTKMMVWGIPVFDARDDIVITTCLDGIVRVLCASSGNLLAYVDVGDEIKASAAFDSISRSVYVVTSGGNVLRLDLDVRATTHKRLKLRVAWKARVGRGAELYASPALWRVGGVLVVVGMDGFVSGLDTRTGITVWRTDIASYSTSSPTISADGVGYVGTSEGRLVAFDTTSGRILGCIALRVPGATDERCQLNSSVALFGRSPRILIGSYDGGVYCVAADFFKRTTPCDLHTISRVSHFEPMNTRQHQIVTLRFRGYADPPSGTRLDHLAVRANTVRVRRIMDARRGGETAMYRIITSADGQFVNLVPRLGQFQHLQWQGTVRVAALAYEQSSSWIYDNLIARRFSIAQSVSSDVEIFAPMSKVPTPPPTTTSPFEGHAIMRWDVFDLVLTQPRTLETYVPAALDGQAFVAFGVNFDHAQRTFDLILLPATRATPDSEQMFVVLPAVSRVIVMRATYHGAWFQAYTRSAVTFSAMGGTMPMRHVELHGCITTGHVDFLGDVGCLGIRGNGAPYKFSDGLVNKTCDARLRASAIGSLRMVRRPESAIKIVQKHLLSPELLTPRNHHLVCVVPRQNGSGETTRTHLVRHQEIREALYVVKQSGHVTLFDDVVVMD